MSPTQSERPPWLPDANTTYGIRGSAQASALPTKTITGGYAVPVVDKHARGRMLRWAPIIRLLSLLLSAAVTAAAPPHDAAAFQAPTPTPATTDTATPVS